MPAARSRASPFNSPRLRHIGERRLLRALGPYLTPAGGHLLVGARDDDDAAIWKSEDGMVVATVDTMVEDLDFRLEWPGLTFRHLGRRLMTINLSDLAAMAAEPRHALISLCLPGSLTLRNVTDLYRGITERAREYRCTVAGGDLSATDGPIVMTAALYGVVQPGQHPLRRTGARPDWAIAVTGVLGRSAAALALLFAGRTPRTAAERRWIRSLFDPVPRVRAGRVLARSGLQIAGDISDGLYREIERFIEPAGLGATIEADAIPVDPEVRRRRGYEWHGQNFGWAGALMESDDYELVCAGPRKVVEAAARRLWRADRLRLSIIGNLTAQRGIRVRLNGKLVPIPSVGAGYEHFR